MQINVSLILSKHGKNAQSDDGSMNWPQMNSFVFNVDGKEKT